MRNMGVWMGSVDPDGIPTTIKLEKIDIGNAGAAADSLAALTWLPDPSEVSCVVETQTPRNIPARIVAATAFGFLRGRGYDCQYSGPKLKDGAMKALAIKHDVRLCGRGYAARKRNSVSVAKAALSGDRTASATMENARDASGRKKADDMADAFLLGYGLWMKIKTTTKIQKR